MVLYAENSFFYEAPFSLHRLVNYTGGQTFYIKNSYIKLKNELIFRKISINISMIKLGIY